MSEDCCKDRDEQIIVLRERMARMETRLDLADKALTLANEVKESTTSRQQTLIIGVITVALMAAGTLLTLLLHLSHGG